MTELSLSPFGHENIENINETIKAYCYNDTYFDNTIYHKFTIGGRQSGLKYLFKRLKYYPKSVSYNLFNMMAIKRLLKSGVLDDENSQWLTHLSEWKIRFWHVPVLAFEKHGVSYNPVALEAISCQTPMTSMLFTRQFQMYKNILNEGNGCHNSIDAPRLLSRIYEVLT